MDFAWQMGWGIIAATADAQYRLLYRCRFRQGYILKQITNFVCPAPLHYAHSSSLSFDFLYVHMEKEIAAVSPCNGVLLGIRIELPYLTLG